MHPLIRQEKLVGSINTVGTAKTDELKSKLADMLQGSGALLLAAEGTVPQIQDATSETPQKTPRAKRHRRRHERNAQ
jgi:hypothetical protein